MADFAALVNQYKALVAQNNNSDEVYKWKCIQTFQEHWDLNATDFPSMVKKSLAGKSNLMYRDGHWFLLTASQHFPSELKVALEELLDEEIPLATRIGSYQSFANEMIEQLRSVEGKKNLQHNQDERTISFLLTCTYPEKYSFYKSNIYTQLCEYLDVVKQKTGHRLVHWYEMQNELKDLIGPDLIHLSESFIPADISWDDNRALLFQDACYRCLVEYTEQIENRENNASHYTATSIQTMTLPSLNQIFYGPPGTGKTYRTSQEAINIINPDFLKVNRSRKEVKAEFNRLHKEGYIDFITFHQSFTYEDFIEGIKPNLLDNQNESSTSNIGFKVESGIFKTIVQKAIDKEEFEETTSTDIHIEPSKFETNVNKISLGNSLDPGDAPIYQYCIDNNCIALGFGEDIDFSQVKTKADIRRLYVENGISITGDNDFNVAAIERFKLWMKPGQLVFVSSGLRKLKAIGEITGEYYCDPNTPISYSQFRKVKWLHKDLDIPVQEIMERQFSQQSIYQIIPAQIKIDFFSKKTDKVSNKSRFVLIIDEINRGNISQIFGELITCLEEDKRLGRTEALKVTLPYSKEAFGVPSNLHIIGTMNTADRSVEALDSALRRRFEFTEIAPDPTVIENSVSNIDVAQVLRTINQRIEWLKDKNHMIGHSDLMKAKNPEKLYQVFNEKIIPLLEEYFYNAPEEIGHILGKDFVEKINSPWKNGETPDGYDGDKLRVRMPVDIPSFLKALRTGILGEAE